MPLYLGATAADRTFLFIFVSIPLTLPQPCTQTRPQSLTPKLRLQLLPPSCASKLDSVFWLYKKIILIKSNLFLFYLSHFSVISKKPFTMSRVMKTILWIFSKKLCIELLCLGLGSIFVNDTRGWSTFILLHVAIQFLVLKTIIAPRLCLSPANNNWL